MEKRFLGAFFVLTATLFYNPSTAQVANPYILNGNAYQENCHCYTLTNDLHFVSGSMWNQYKIDLTQSFDFSFNVNLGCRDADGADGIAFVLQPISTSIGNTGQGLGFGGISPSVGIVIDTWQNTDFLDPYYDHMGIYKNGDVNNNNTYDQLATPVAALPANANIEDCQWHVFHIIWNASTKNLSAQIDGAQKIETTIDIVNKIFAGDPMVYWGFTGSTGGSTNRQRVCTSLNAQFTTPDNTSICAPTTINFKDSSISFGSIVKWIWDFGDGTTAADQQPSPHVFATPGIYNVKLNIVGNDGCLSDTFQRQILIGSKPIADFKFPPGEPCQNSPVLFVDSSYVEFGSINSWTWSFSNQPSINTTAGRLSHSFDGGNQTVTLTVGTKEGCVSDPTTRSLLVLSSPDVNMQTQNACFGNPVTLQATNTNAQIAVQNWYWQLGDGSSDTLPTVTHNYTEAGQFPVSLFAMGTNGCFSDTATGTVNIYRTQAFAGNDTIAAAGQPVQLHGSGGVLYKWEPPFGLDDNNIQDPVATLQTDASYVLTAYTDVGCPTSDTILIKIYKGPAIYVPSAFTPNNDGKNDRFRCVAVGMTNIDFFNVYNRYGQLMYSSKNTREGWDGTLHGVEQPVGTYVWMVQGIDYHGAKHFEKGTVTLIR